LQRGATRERARRSSARCAALGVGLAFAVGSAAPAAAQTHRLVLDPDASRVAFTLGATLHTAEGSLAPVDGALRFSPEGGPMTGRIVVAARSAETGIARRDARMHAEVLESERFPEIVFHAETLEVEALRADTAPPEADVVVQGELEIHGRRHPLSVPATLRGDGGSVEIEARFSAPYVEWGMTDVSGFLLRVDPYVDVTVRARGRIEPPVALRGPP